MGSVAVGPSDCAIVCINMNICTDGAAERCCVLWSRLQPIDWVIKIIIVINSRGEKCNINYAENIDIDFLQRSHRSRGDTCCPQRLVRIYAS